MPSHFNLVIEGDTNDGDMAIASNVIDMEATFLHAGELWPSQPIVTHSAFFAAFGAALRHTAEENCGQNWDNEYTSGSARKATLTHLVEALGASAQDLSELKKNNFEILRYILCRYIGCRDEAGVRVITSIVATPVEGSVTFY